MGIRSFGRSRPERFHAAVALNLALLGTAVWLYLFRHHFSWYHLLAGWLLSINLTAFGYYGYDKACARRAARRVPEVFLHGLALAGGSPAAYLAMRLYRHKTVKGRFRFAFWGIVVFQLLLIGWVGWLLWRHHA
jgi:uncharacterized membrane protein YsdA (DUF1294 family)